MGRGVASWVGNLYRPFRARGGGRLIVLAVGGGELCCGVVIWGDVGCSEGVVWKKGFALEEEFLRVAGKVLSGTW